MLNPELIEYYGEECKTFFDEFVKRVSPDLIGKCYAIKGLRIDSGRLCGPQLIGVVDCAESVRRVCAHCLDITSYLKDENDDRDEGVLTVTRTLESVKEDGIKIWV